MLIYVVSDQSYQLAAFSTRAAAITYRDKHAELWDGDPEDYNIVAHNLDRCNDSLCRTMEKDDDQITIVRHNCRPSIRWEYNMVLDYKTRQRLTRQRCMDLNALDIVDVPGVMAALQQHWWEELQEDYRDELETENN